jgi:Recombination endonuclease VII
MTPCKCGCGLPCRKSLGGRPTKYASERCMKRVEERRYRKKYPERIREKAKRRKAKYPERSREKAREKNRRYATKYSERSRERKLWQNYRLTLEGRTKILAYQGGVCAICGTTGPGGLWWHTDHKKGTFVVRGILCHGCNTGLGCFRENPEALRKAADYLMRDTTPVAAIQRETSRTGA